MDISERKAALLRAYEAVAVEAGVASAKWPPFHSLHEGYAVLLEEVDELWTECKQREPDSVTCPNGRIKIESEVEDELDKEVAADLKALGFNLNLSPPQEGQLRENLIARLEYGRGERIEARMEEHAETVRAEWEESVREEIAYALGEDD